MKKLARLASFATLLAFGALTTAASPVQLPGTEDAEKQTYIVTLGANPGVNGDKARSKVLNELAYKLPEESYDITAEYDTVLNGFAVETYPECVEVIENVTGVDSITIEHRYAAPQTADTTASTTSLVGDFAEAKLGNYSAETIDATTSDINSAIAARGGDSEAQLGKGITIGIIDTGLILNQVEGSQERNTTVSNAANAGKTLNPAAFQDLPDEEGYDVLTTDAIDAAGLGHAYQRYGNKIAFAYDYDGNDDNVNPDPEDGNHGTHVASLAASNGEAFKGIAPNAQLAVMKVFPDNASGAGDTAIIAALNDAAKLKLDIVNLSLGTDLIDSGDNASSTTYQAIQGAVDAGVIVNYAAGNAGKSSFSSSQGYSDFTTDTTEPSILGSSSLFDERANIVASSNPEKAFFNSIVTVGDSVISYDDQVVNKEGSSLSYDFQHPLTELLDSKYNTNDGSFKFLRVGGYGTYSDYEAAIQANGGLFEGKLSNADKTDGYVAVIDRGNTTFQSKAQAAENAGAIALIVINDNPSVTFNFSFDFNDYNPTIPIVLVYQSLGPVFGAVNSTGELSIAQNSVENAPDGNIFSSFSSDGPSYDLDLAPTVSAPGSAVIGAISADITGTTSGIVGYDNMSGTSMATPNFSGALASILSEKKPANGGSLAATDDAAFAQYKKLDSSMAMAPADPV